MCCCPLGQFRNKCTFDPPIYVAWRLRYLIQLELNDKNVLQNKLISDVHRRCTVINTTITFLCKNV